MCIIAIYKSKEQLNKDTIERMARSNSDGMGYAYADGKNVYAAKGFTNPVQVYSLMRRAFENGAHTVVFHARIATSGGVCAARCHPFPLTMERSRLNADTFTTTDAAIFHNGVFDIAHKPDESDTQAFIARVLAPFSARVLSGGFDEIINLAVKGSRLAVLTPRGVRLYGTGWVKDGGAWYSNSGYKPYAYAWSGIGAYGHGYGLATPTYTRATAWDADEDDYLDRDFAYANAASGKEGKRWKNG